MSQTNGDLHRYLKRTFEELEQRIVKRDSDVSKKCEAEKKKLELENDRLKRENDSFREVIGDVLKKRLALEKALERVGISFEGYESDRDEDNPANFGRLCWGCEKILEENKMLKVSREGGSCFDGSQLEEKKNGLKSLGVENEEPPNHKDSQETSISFNTQCSQTMESPDITRKISGVLDNLRKPISPSFPPYGSDIVDHTQTELPCSAINFGEESMERKEKKGNVKNTELCVHQMREEDRYLQIRPDADAEKPKYRYLETVRKKDERAKLPPGECRCCSGFMRALNIQGEARKEFMRASRHRETAPAPPVLKDFWEVGFPSSEAVPIKTIEEWEDQQREAKRRKEES
eukprot:Nk52_evm15s2039 gene=Nk52_evmTU15s2039